MEANFDLASHKKNILTSIGMHDFTTLIIVLLTIKNPQLNVALITEFKAKSSSL
jgi:hypothetical protein